MSRGEPGTGFGQRDQAESGDKKAFRRRQTENEGTEESAKFNGPEKTVPRLASSFSLTEKLVPQSRDRDESNPTGILTRGLRPRSRLPSLWLVALGVCNPSQWRNRPRFPRGSLTLDCHTKSGHGPPISQNESVVEFPGRITRGFRPSLSQWRLDGPEPLLFLFQPCFQFRDFVRLQRPIGRHVSKIDQNTDGMGLNQEQGAPVPVCLVAA